MSTQSLDGIRSLLVSSFENCTREQAQQLVDRYSSIPLLSKNIDLGKEEGEREQGFLIRHIEAPKKYGTRFLMINDLSHFPDPQSCLIISYDAATNRIKGYQRCQYVKDLSVITSKEKTAIERCATFSLSHRLAQIVLLPVLYLVAYLFGHTSIYSSMIVYGLPLNNLSLDIPPQLLRSVQIRFQSFESLYKSATIPKRYYSHMVIFETYSFQIIKVLIMYTITTMLFLGMAALLWNVLTHLF
ncbi:MAG: hypothetical protein AAB400_00610 [Patescibacteria group bacterium]